LNRRAEREHQSELKAKLRETSQQERQEERDQQALLRQEDLKNLPPKRKQ
jgi:hypothetical protein